MLAYCDLHIHSCLSPCGDDEMTPWNVVGMARVKGLEVIAVTDHNTALNIPQAARAGRAYGVAVVPGLEVTTREEVHMLAYFAAEADALAFGEALYAHLPDIANREDLFGRQTVIGDDDLPVGSVSRLLLNATDLSLAELGKLTREHGGEVVPAHINRGANGMIGSLGLMPPLPDYPVVEVYRRVPCPAYATKNRAVWHASDAHRLEDIAEREFALELEEPSAAAVLALLRRLNNEARQQYR